MNPTRSEFAISKMPLEVVVPNNFSKFWLFKISESIKVISSKREYKLLSIDANNVSKILFIVSIIVWVILFVLSKITSLFY